ncbi:MAG: guanylyltransferase, partial [Phycisphaerae bacterium]|jgi:tRNA(His) 5'-end guanylyltransferase|nr:guanylyltransferase [Phycisphaerae bacterium]
VNFNDVPKWQKSGIGFYWETFEKEATNPVTGEPVAAKRRRIASDMDLPMRDEYSSFLLSLFENTDQ